MKKIIFLVSFSILLMFLASCDPCKDTKCQNGGICDNGTCDCSPGYSGTQCQNYNPCHNVICQNGGTCVNGNCNCPTGYYGSNCQFRSACYFDNTGSISVQNLSTRRYVYRVLVGGNFYGTCSYGQTVSVPSLRVGSYKVEIFINGTTTKACADTQLSVVRCSDSGISCSY